MYEHFKQGDFVRCTNNEAYEDCLSLYKDYLVIVADVDGLICVVDNEGNTRWFSKERFKSIESRISVSDNTLQQILSITEEHPEIEVIVSQGKFSVDYCSDSHHRIIKVESLQDTLECVKLMKQWLEVEVALKELEEK